MANFLFELGAKFLLERPVRDTPVSQLVDSLERNGKKLEARFSNYSDCPGNRQLLRHIIGIERWGTRRLQVLLGETILQDEYDGYAPAENTPLEELRAQFSQTRADTLTLARELEAAKKKLSKVPHNQYGELSVRAWLRYLDMHANGEAHKGSTGK